MTSVPTHAAFLGLISLVVIASPHANADDCRVYDGSIRIDTASQLDDIQDICEIRGNLGIFPDDVASVNLPKLKTVRMLNVESDSLVALAVPQLAKAEEIFLTGPKLAIAELPSLKRISRTFYVKTRHIQYLHLPNLGYVGKLNIQGNLELEFVFADSLYNVRELLLENNPMLNAGSAAMLRTVTYVMSEAEKQYIQQAQADIRELKQRLLEQAANEPPMPPTGHPSGFGTVGFYYQWYPHHFWQYWHGLGPWGFQLPYKYLVWF